MCFTWGINMDGYSRQLYLFPKYVDDIEDGCVAEDHAQRELNNFWNRKKSNREIGALYERYIGYLYEEAGYHVKYTGIDRGCKDMGRDLICRCGSQVLIIQCKNWNFCKKVHVKCVYQLHGTLNHYQSQYPSRIVKGVLFTASLLSKEARAAAIKLKIEVHEHYLMRERFPVIKCKSNDKRYYLPDDWGYNEIQVIFGEGDCYCLTVTEAEWKGFKR